MRFARVSLIGFVLAWVFGPYALRSTVPVWLPFLIAVALEAQFFARGLLPGASGRETPDRGPQEIDRERYGYPEQEASPFEEEGRWPEPWHDADPGDQLEEDEEWATADEAQPESFSGRRPRRRVRQLLIGLSVIGALVLLVWLADSRGWKGLDADAQVAATERFSAEASRIAGHPVSIQCDESGDHVGVVQHADGAAEVGGDQGYLTPAICHDLYRLAFEGEVRFSQTARALAVLAHEAWHLQGVGDEGTTECYALQSGAELGTRLGLDEETAGRMMRNQLVENAGRSDLEYLVPPECRDGGELDLDRSTSDFP
jgi:hypothetical protein